MPGGGEGTILLRLCSQPGERRPGPGALPTARRPPGSPHPRRARCRPGLARHPAQGRGPGAQWALQSLAGSVPREAPPPRQGLGIPGRAPLDAAWATRRARGPAEWSEALVSPTPSSVPARSPAAYNGVPSPAGLSGGWGDGHLSCAGSSRYLRGPPPRGRQSSAWSLEPRELSSCRQSPDQMLCHVLLALAWVSGPLPEAWRCGTTRPPGGGSGCQVVAALLGLEGKLLAGVWVCPPGMAGLVGPGENPNNGSHVYCALQFANRFTVYEVLCSLWFTVYCTVDKVLEAFFAKCLPPDNRVESFKRSLPGSQMGRIFYSF